MFFCENMYAQRAKDAPEEEGPAKKKHLVMVPLSPARPLSLSISVSLSLARSLSLAPDYVCICLSLVRVVELSTVWTRRAELSAVGCDMLRLFFRPANGTRCSGRRERGRREKMLRNLLKGHYHSTFTYRAFCWLYLGGIAVGDWALG